MNITPKKMEIYSEEIRKIFIKKPKGIIRYGNLLIFTILIILMLIFSHITPITLLYKADVNYENENILNINVKSTELNNLISKDTYIYLTESNNSHTLNNRQIKCKILTISHTDENIHINALLLEQNLNDIDQYKFVRIDDIPIYKVLNLKIRYFFSIITSFIDKFNYFSSNP